MKRLFLIFAFCLLPFAMSAADLFDQETPVIGGINVFDSSNIFSEIFEKLDQVNFGGKDIRVAIESLETLAPKIHIAVTDNRIVVVDDDVIIGNWSRPVDGDWRGFGQITTAILLKIRDVDAGLRAGSQSSIYSMAVAAMTRALDANGRFVASRSDDGRVLTSAGLQGNRDSRGYWRVNGVFKGSQADTSGINDGDLIVEINGVDVAQMNDAEMIAALAGYNSGTLKLKVASQAGVKNIALRRASIVMADADIIWRQGADILEIIIHSISENSVAIVNEALAKYDNSGGIILDLRVASGGDERAAAKLAGLFVGGVPVMRIDEVGADEVEVIPGGDAVTDAPLVILVSSATKGAAEGIAAALGDNNRGILIGTPTAGFARLVTRIELSGGGAIELGNRSIKSGQGIKLDGRGVFPVICLSNIRNQNQQEAFFLNIINDDFNAENFNRDEMTDVEKIRHGCPAIKSGETEDAIAMAIAVQFLTDKKAYSKVISDIAKL